ncbi:RimK/LysX family protein [Oceanispirochaeta sp.]|uniref:ATP-dependent zinc protease family protein n=1 Tax=Oceanispirochaeta sp. TaxID=2035350 RepID=UPI00260C3FC1|nr:RimK/LysX family protein [Oceanispirochaeta sp.]MDA3956262.1 RimK/LysX family protein [Oceanispirochaeta sp.]
MKKDFSDLIALGWREWISFPDWEVSNIKVKVDTGARTSSLHVGELEYFEKDSKSWVSFDIYPWQKTSRENIQISAPVTSFKYVKSSSGCQEKRPVIIARLIIAGQEIMTELTLTNRSTMGFRMLLGRGAIKKHFMVIPGKSYLGGKPPIEIRRKNRGRI